jgi:fructoselysine-6-P-deglycase FrlB-like protein
MTDTGAALAAMLLPVQQFAFATADRRGRNPDAPVNLSRVVTF